MASLADDIPELWNELAMETDDGMSIENHHLASGSPYNNPEDKFERLLMDDETSVGGFTCTLAASVDTHHFLEMGGYSTLEHSSFEVDIGDPEGFCWVDFSGTSLGASIEANRPENYDENMTGAELKGPGPYTTAMAKYIVYADIDKYVQYLADWLHSEEGQAKVLEQYSGLKGDGGPEGVAARFLRSKHPTHYA